MSEGVNQNKLIILKGLTHNEPIDPVVLQKALMPHVDLIKIVWMSIWVVVLMVVCFRVISRYWGTRRDGFHSE
mgnify:CR=1 FL=1